jgi:hypothetical protein
MPVMTVVTRWVVTAMPPLGSKGAGWMVVKR